MASKKKAASKKAAPKKNGATQDDRKKARAFRAAFRRIDGGVPRLLVVRPAGLYTTTALYYESEDPDGRENWERVSHDERAAHLLGKIVAGDYERE
jgi:hypothetical protein